MDVFQIKVFIHAVINYGHLGFLNLDNQDLLCFYEECIIIAEYLGDISLMTAVLELLGQFYAEKYGFTESSTHFKNLLKKIKLPEGFRDRRFKDLAYRSICQAYNNLCKYSEALEYSEKRLNIVIEIGDKELEGRIYGDLGTLYLKLNRYDEVIEYSQKSLNIARELDDKDVKSLSLLNLGNAMLHFGKTQKAIQYYEKSLSVAKETHDNRIEGCCYNNLGQSYQLLGKNDDALIYLKKGLEVCTKIGDKKGQAASFRSLGIVYRILGKYEEAINYHKKSLNIAEEIGDKDAEGMAYTNLGGTSWLLAKYYDANNYLEKALKVSQEIGDRRGEGQVYQNLSGLYASLGKHIVANQYLENNFNIVKEIGSKDQMVNAYGNMGISNHELGKFWEATHYLKKSVEIATEIGDMFGRESALRHLGMVYRSVGKYDKSIECLNKSLKIATKVGDKEGKASVYKELGMIYNSRGKSQEAIQHFLNSVNLSRDIGDKRNEGLSNHMLGKIYHQKSYFYSEQQYKEQHQHAMERSIYFLKEALRCWDWHFQHLQNLDEFKISLSDSFTKTYKLLTTVMIKDQQFEEALLVCDRGRARALGDLLNLKYGVNPQHALTSSTPLQYADVTTMLAGNTFCVMFLAVSDQDINIWILTHQKPLFFVKSEGVLSLIKTSQSEDRKPIRMKELLTDVINDICLSIKVNHSGKYENRSLEPPLNSHIPRIDIVDEMETSSVSPIGRERNIAPIEGGKCSPLNADPLEFLFNLLVSPVLQKLEQEEIIIIPDGPLYTVPFAALRDPTTGLFLSETKCIRLAPSLASLKTLQDCPENHHCKTGALIVGDPDVGEVMLRGEKGFLPRLPSAKHEAEIIGATLKVKPLTGLEATKEMVKQKLLEDVAVIHIAAHGDAEKGHIALAPSTRTKATRIPEEEDYMLTMQEVQEIGVRAQLVVLSCCHSGRGEINAEGVVGISRAFLAAGARAVVASLWAIDDEATLSFMVSFYTYLQMGESASKSLQKAMKDMREEGYVEPKYWAPFFLIGDDVTISV